MKLELPYVISVSANNGKLSEIEEQLKKDDVKFFRDIVGYESSVYGFDGTELGREFCAFMHENYFEGYFENCEKNSTMQIFWGEQSDFKRMFEQLDLTNVIELACGRGRHVSQYYFNAGKVLLIDVLGKNIDYCKIRFKEYSNIEYYKNNGYDLGQCSDESYTALFTYDAMVHFELLDIYNYLKETYRVLKSGGKALFHHSNNSSDYRNSFLSAQSRRNFMDKNIFAYMAYKCGFEIIEQKEIDWSIPNLDCISLLRKP